MMRAKMKNWAIVGAQLNPYQAPELQAKQLRGQVFGHERFEDGECVTTSTIIKREGNEIITKNTAYWLGEVCPDYQAWCDEHGHDPYPKT